MFASGAEPGAGGFELRLSRSRFYGLFRGQPLFFHADHVLVQCAANYRASAMTYLYRVVVEKVDEASAAEDLHAVWTPSEENQRWSDYVAEIKASGR